MIKLSRILFIASYLFLINPSAYCQDSMESISPHDLMQNSKRAQEYFEDEINFTTSPYGLHTMIEGKKDIIIIDVRSEQDFIKGHIPGAINLPVEKYESFNGNEAEFIGLRNDKFNYVYCYDLLCNAATKACRKFASLGYPVKEVRGGFKSWQEHNYPIQK